MDACTQVGTSLLVSQIPRKAKALYLAEVECWHPLATANGSALSAISGPGFQFLQRLGSEGILDSTCCKGDAICCFECQDPIATVALNTEPLAVANGCQHSPSAKYSCSRFPGDLAHKRRGSNLSASIHWLPPTALY